MKKLLFIIGVVLAIVGCEKVDMFGRKYSEYPIAGKSYKYVISDVYSQIYTFKTNGECDMDDYKGDYCFGGVYDYRWWMEEDSIFISVDDDPTYKYIDGKYYGDYITIFDHKLKEVQ